MEGQFDENVKINRDVLTANLNHFSSIRKLSIDTIETAKKYENALMIQLDRYDDGADQSPNSGQYNIIEGEIAFWRQMIEDSEGQLAAIDGYIQQMQNEFALQSYHDQEIERIRAKVSHRGHLVSVAQALVDYYESDNEDKYDQAIAASDAARGEESRLLNVYSDRKTLLADRLTAVDNARENIALSYQQLLNARNNYADIRSEGQEVDTDGELTDDSAAIRDKMRAAQEEIENRRVDYLQSLQSFETANQEYEGVYNQMLQDYDNYFNVYQNARVARAVVEQGEYAQPNWDPKDLLETYQREYNRQQEILAHLEKAESGIGDNAKKLEYISNKEEQLTLRSLYGVLSATYDEFKRRKNIADDKWKQAFDNYARKAENIFVFNGPLRVLDSEEAHIPDNLDDIVSLLSGKSYDEYYIGEEEVVESRFQKDAMLFIAALEIIGADTPTKITGLLSVFGRYYFYRQQQFDPSENYHRINVTVKDRANLEPMQERMDYYLFDHNLRDRIDDITAQVAGSAQHIPLFLDDNQMRLYDFFEAVIANRRGKFNASYFDSVVNKEISHLFEAWYIDRILDARVTFIFTWRPDVTAEITMAQNLPEYDYENIKQQTLELLNPSLESIEELRNAASEANQLRYLDSDTFVSIAQDGNYQITSEIQSRLQNLWNNIETDDLSTDNFHLIDTVVKQLEAIDTSVGDVFNEIIASWQGKYNNYRDMLSQEAYDTITLKREIGALFGDKAFGLDDMLALEMQYAEDIIAYDHNSIGVKQQIRENIIHMMFDMSHSQQIDWQREKHSLQGEQLMAQSAAWIARAQLLFSTGNEEWERVKVDADQRRAQWRDDFSDQYISGASRWKESYDNLLVRRANWLVTAQQRALQEESHNLLENVGLDVAHLSIPLLPLVSDPDRAQVEELIAETFDEEKMLSLMSHAERLANTGADLALIDDMPLERSQVAISVLRGADQYTESVIEEIADHTARIASLQMEQSLEERLQLISEQVEKSNDDVENSMNDILDGGGYRRNGRNYRRDILIDKTLFEGNEFENQFIEGYRRYIPVTFETVNWPSNSSYSNLIAVRRDLIAIGKKIEQYYNSIFADSDGLLAIHIGEAPEMRQENPEEVSDPGSGELGRILTLFFRNQAREARGFVDLKTLPYELPLWDDDLNNDGKSDGLIAAPSIRSLGSLAISVLSSAVGLPPGVGGLISEALFGIADIANGKDAETIAFNIGKGIASALIGQGIGEVFSHIDLSSLTGLGLAVGEGAIAGIEGFANNITGGFVNSFQFDEDGALYFDDDIFTDKLIGQDALASLAGGVGGNFVKGALTGGELGFSLTDRRRLDNFTNFAGGTIGAGITGAISGKLHLNILNSNDIANIFDDTIDVPGTGLLELTIGGEEGAQLSFGSGGTNIGASRIIDAIDGIEVWKDNLEIIDFSANNVDFLPDYQGGKDATAALRVNYSAARHDQSIAEQYRRFLDGNDRLVVGNGLGEAETSIHGDQRTVRISSLGDINDKNARLHAGIVLAHEAHRDGIVKNRKEQQVETLSAVLGHTLVAQQVALNYGSDSLNEWVRDEVELLEAARSDGSLSSFVAAVLGDYDSRGDYWRLTEDGNLEWDGKLDITDWNDNILVEDTTGSFSQSLIKAIGSERAAEILGIELDELSLYDEQTLVDVTGYGRAIWDSLIQMGVDFDTLFTSDQRQKMAGEAIMKDSGMVWDGSWTNGEGVAFSMSGQDIKGQIYISDTLVGDEYERFAVTSSIYRNEDSYLGRYGDLDNQRLDFLVAEKRGLDGGLIERHVMQNLQTVDIYDRVDSNGVDRNQEVESDKYGTIQGNTIAPGELWMKVGAESQYVGGALVINNARLLSGDYIDEFGRNDRIGGGRWLLHANRTEDMVEDYNNAASDGCFIPSTIAQLEFMDTLERWGLKSGYNIRSELREFSLN